MKLKIEQKNKCFYKKLILNFFLIRFFLTGFDGLLSNENKVVTRNKLTIYTFKAR